MFGQGRQSQASGQQWVGWGVMSRTACSPQLWAEGGRLGAQTSPALWLEDLLVAGSRPRA